MKYSIIYADPPWKAVDSGTGMRGTSDLGKRYKGVMTIEEIEQLPVRDIAAENSILFLWVTFPRLLEGIRAMQAWGFKYKSLGFNWVKENKKSDSLFWGMGYYTRQNSEICLIGARGKFPRQARNVHSVVISKIEEHSKKPDCIRDKILQICGDLPRVELFARQATPGWDVWGNEVASTIELEANKNENI